MDKVTKQYLAYQEQTGHCTYCPRLCRSACPVETASGSESLTPKYKMQIFAELLANKVPIEMDAIAPIFGCTDCGACEEQCLHGNEVGDALYQARGFAQKRGLSSPLLEMVLHPFQIAKKSVRSVSNKREVLLHGCTHPFVTGDALKKFISFMAEREPNIAYDASFQETDCCGRRLREAGYLDAYLAHQKNMQEWLANYSTWWVLDPACLPDFEQMAETANYRHPPKVKLFYDLLFEKNIAVKQKVSSLVLHLPCAVKKRASVYQTCMALAARVSEAYRTISPFSPFAACCGANGCLPLTYPKVAETMAKEQIHALHDLAVSDWSTPVPIATFSSSCGMHLNQYAKFPVQSILEFFL